MHRPRAYTSSRRAARLALAFAACAIACAVPGACAKGDPTPDELAIRATFDAYRAALGARDGERAAALVGPATLAWYEVIRGHALHTDAAGLGALRVIDRLLVLTARHAVPAERLEGLDGAGLFAVAVTSDWTSMGFETLGLGDVSADADEGRGTLTLDGQATPVRLAFTRTPAGWRFEPVQLAPLLEDNLRAIPKHLERDESAWLLETVAATVGSPVDASLWIPPRPTGE